MVSYVHSVDAPLHIPLKKQPANFEHCSWGIIGAATGLHPADGLKDAPGLKQFRSLLHLPEQQ
jgi:hypothetical protein